MTPEPDTTPKCDTTDSRETREEGNENRLTGQEADASAPLPDVPSAASTFREVNGVELHVVAAGDSRDPLVVLLHGYPEFWYGWRDYVAPLVEAGYRVLVPDQRGYNRSEKPSATRAYRTGELAADVAGLVDMTDHDSAHVVGHDWGGVIAWELALRHPGSVQHLGILNAPHPTVFQQTLTSSVEQLKKSWYMFLYQVPRVAEWYIRRDNFQKLVDSLRDDSEEAFTDADFRRYRAAWSRDGALTAMMKWYRALFRHRQDPPRESVAAPTKVLWGENDGYLATEMARLSVEYCEDGRLERFPDATHWINHERHEAVLDHLVEFFEGDG